jgi:hypothetical protein
MTGGTQAVHEARLRNCGDSAPATLKAGKYRF